MEELALRIDAGLLALLDHEVAIERHRQAAKAAETGANPKKKTRTQVVRDILVVGLKLRAEARGEEFPLIEPAERVKPPTRAEPLDVVPAPVESIAEKTKKWASRIEIPMAELLAPDSESDPRPPTPPRRIGVTRRTESK